MGFQMRLWSCVPKRSQMSPPLHPQVQILRRRDACRGLKEGEDGGVVQGRRSGTEISFFLFFFLALNIFTLLACVPSM